MRQASKRIPDSAEKTVQDIRRNTRRHHSAEEKIRIVRSTGETDAVVVLVGAMAQVRSAASWHIRALVEASISVQAKQSRPLPLFPQ